MCLPTDADKMMTRFFFFFFYRSSDARCNILITLSICSANGDIKPFCKISLHLVDNIIVIFLKTLVGLLRETMHIGRRHMTYSVNLSLTLK